MRIGSAQRANTETFLVHIFGEILAAWRWNSLSNLPYSPDLKHYFLTAERYCGESVQRPVIKSQAD